MPGGASEGDHGIVPTKFAVAVPYIRNPTDTRQLTSPQGEADGVTDGRMTLQAWGGGEFALR